MCPYVYQALYKGALGEEALYALMKAELKITLQPLPHQWYEKFDFYFTNLKGNTVFFDAKLWKADPLKIKQDIPAYIDQVFKKMDDCETKLAFIINVCSQHPDAARLATPSYQRNGKTIVPIPMLTDRTGKVDYSYLNTIVYAIDAY